MVAGAEFAGALVGPESFEGERQEDGWAGHARHDAANVSGGWRIAQTM